MDKKTKVKADSGYQGIEQLHANSLIPKKGSKQRPLSAADKEANTKLAKERVSIEHIIARIKVFRMLAERYRNRRQKHTIRVKLICAIYNYELK